MSRPHLAAVAVLAASFSLGGPASAQSGALELLGRARTLTTSAKVLTTLEAVSPLAATVSHPPTCALGTCPLLGSLAHDLSEASLVMEQAPIGAPHVVVLGYGYAGRDAVDRLDGKGIRLTVIERDPLAEHKTKVWRVITGENEVTDKKIGEPVDKDLGKKSLAHVITGDVSRIDPASRLIELSDGTRVPYDYLVLATGSQPHYFNPEWAQHALPLDKAIDGQRIRDHVLAQIEAARATSDATEQARLLSYIVVGGGATGVEIAGSVAELVQRRAPDLVSALRVTVVQGAETLVPQFGGDTGARTERALTNMGVRVRTGSRVQDITAGRVTLDGGEVLEGQVLWGAGVEASPLTASFGDVLDERGRIRVNEDLTVPGTDGRVFAVGDLARFDVDGVPLPQLKKPAEAAGKHAARNIILGIQGQRYELFKYRPKAKRPSHLGNVKMKKH